MRALSAANAQQVGECRAQGEPFWLDIQGASEIAELHALDETLGISADVIEGLTAFGQPPRLARHGDHALLVFYGARIDEGGQAEPVEVHVALAQDELFTVHRVPVPALVELGERHELNFHHAAEQVLARLTDSLLGVLEAIDDEIDELEDVIIKEPTDPHLRRLTELRRTLIGIRRTATPQRDLFLRELDALAALPELSVAAMREVGAARDGPRRDRLDA